MVINKIKHTLLNWFLLILVFTFLSCSKHYDIKTHNTLNYSCLKEYVGDTVANKYVEKLTVYYPTGELNCQYTIINHLREGEYISYGKNGIVVETKFYVHDKLDGIRKRYFSNGQLLEEARFTNNKINGLVWSYYQNAQFHALGFFKDSILMYALDFDSNGKKVYEEIRPRIERPKTIHLGEKFKMEVMFPILKGLTDIHAFNFAIIPENIPGIDSMKDYLLYSEFKNKKWVYELKNKKKKITKNNYTGSLYTIPMNEQGYGLYEFTPQSLGRYNLKGVLTTFNTNERIKDTAFVEEHVGINFDVIK